MNGIATNVEELTGLLFLEPIQLNRLQDFTSEIGAVGSSHGFRLVNKGWEISSLRPRLTGYSYICRALSPLIIQKELGCSLQDGSMRR